MAADSDSALSFHDMGIDDRLENAIAKLGWTQPTLVQQRAIPLALQGKDVLTRARTGSGKTAAFVIPILQRLLRDGKSGGGGVRALVVVPSKELSRQGCRDVRQLSSSCGEQIRFVDLSAQADVNAQKPLLAQRPDIVIGTPSRIAAHLRAKTLVLSESLQVLAIDEADLLLSFGYENEMSELIDALPKICQVLMTSATLSEQVVKLKKLLLHNPVILKLEESQLPDIDQLVQYHIRCSEDDKYVIIYAMLKLNLVQGRSILFVNTVDRCYKLKLYLQQFAIRSAILNSELPLNSRLHIVEQFNSGAYQLLIASDEQSLLTSARSGAKKPTKRKRDKEFGVARGIDFQHVSNIINFDFPTTADAYIHRVGRTARLDAHGTALSFVSATEGPLLEEVEAKLVQAVGSEVTASTSSKRSVFKPYHFRMDQVDGFRYRSQDALRSVTRVAIREARLREIRAELMTSQRLRTYFDSNPRDWQLLRHDRELHAVRQQTELRYVPDYLVPPILRPAAQSASDALAAPKPRRESDRVKIRRNQGAGSDPLKTFKFEGLAATLETQSSQRRKTGGRTARGKVQKKGRNSEDAFGFDGANAKKRRVKARPPKKRKPRA